MGEISKEDIRESRELILDEMRRGFDVMHRKQDQTNGRLLKLEETTARHDERINGLLDDEDGDDQSDDVKAITRRDLTVAVAAIMAAGAVFAWLARMPGVIH